MTTYFDEAYAGGTNGGTVSTSNTGFDLIGGTAPTFTNDSPIPNTLAMRANSGGATASSGRAPIGASRSPVYITYPMKAAAWASGNWFPHEIRATATIRADCRVPSGVPTIRNGTTAVWTSVVTLSTGAWLWVEHKIDNAGSKQSLTVWDSAGNVIVASGDQTYNSGTADNVVVGNTTAVTGVDVTFGRVRVGDTSFGPIIPSISTSDSGAASDAGSVSATASVTDAATATETFATAATVALSDTAAGVDAPSVSATTATTDAASASDALAADATVLASDVGSATDDLATLQTLGLAEAAAALEALDLSAMAAIDDDGTAIEALVVVASGPTPRPNTGTTTRPDAGITARPDTGITPRP
jgi:hypothetical protein